MKNKTSDIIRMIIFTLLVASTAYAGCSGCGNISTTPPTIDLTPRAEILMPGDSNYTYGDDITFAGIYTGKDICGSTCSYTWSSSRDGPIGTGVSITLNNLSVGTHTIEFRFSDRRGTTMTATKNIVINPAPLQATINLPKPETFYNENDTIALNASISGGVPPYTYLWRLDDTVIGSEEYMEIKTATVGTHNVHFEVKDAADSYTSMDRTVWVNTPADITMLPLTASIKSPKKITHGNEQIIKEGSTVEFEADVAGGKEPYTYSWISDVNGLIGKDEEFAYSNLSGNANGTNTISLTITDSAGFSVSDKTTLTINPICKHDGTCHTEENYYNCPDDCPSGGKDGYCDKVKDGICDPDCAPGEDPDCTCDHNGFCDIGRENYYNCPADCPSGSADGVCDKVKDGICDPDCAPGADPDCAKTDDSKYLLLLILVAALIYAYMRFIRRR